MRRPLSFPRVGELAPGCQGEYPHSPLSGSSPLPSGSFLRNLLCYQDAGQSVRSLIEMLPPVKLCQMEGENAVHCKQTTVCIFPILATRLQAGGMHFLLFSRCCKEHRKTTILGTRTNSSLTTTIPCRRLPRRLCSCTNIKWATSYREKAQQNVRPDH